MDLKPEGARIAQLGAPERAKYGKDLVSGKVNVSQYTKNVCYDTVAFTRFLLGSSGITPKDVVTVQAQGWVGKLKFDSGTKWDGTTAMKAGSAVGFYRVIDKRFFHCALATGGSKVRAVNGHVLGAGWEEVDLKKILGDADKEKQFDFDGAKIEVWISKV